MHNWTKASVYQLEMNYEIEAVILAVSSAGQGTYQGCLYGGPEGPYPLPNTIFPLTNFDFSHYQLPIWLFLVSDFEFSHYQLPIWVFLISTTLVYYRRCQLCAYANVL